MQVSQAKMRAKPRRCCVRNRVCHTCRQLLSNAPQGRGVDTMARSQSCEARPARPAPHRAASSRAAELRRRVREQQGILLSWAATRSEGSCGDGIDGAQVCGWHVCGAGRHPVDRPSSGARSRPRVPERCLNTPPSRLCQCQLRAIDAESNGEYFSVHSWHEPRARAPRPTQSHCLVSGLP